MVVVRADIENGSSTSALTGLCAVGAAHQEVIFFAGAFVVPKSAATSFSFSGMAVVTQPLAPATLTLVCADAAGNSVVPSALLKWWASPVETSP